MPRVLIVDDSRLMRRVLTSVIEAMNGFEVSGVATSAEEAERSIEASRPDVIVLDVNLPGMDGFTFLSRLRQRHRTPVVLISSQGFAEIARARGGLPDEAFSFIEKPDGVRRTLDDFRRELGAMLVGLAVGRSARAAEPAPIPTPVARPSRYRLIAIGASTGGVDAVTALLSSLRAPLPPVVITLHMPAMYTYRFAQRLATVTGHAVDEAQDREALSPGQVRVAPGGLQLRVENRSGAPVTLLSDDPPVSGHKPSVDALFHSVAASFGRAAIGTILTGMGRDGAEGLLAMRRAGALTFGEASESCIVYGMPKAAMDIGAVEHELPLDALGREIMRALGA
ncbi:chemotaxis-specific protein-glutamate methyltransferase CheB [Benzoatithermus flavus]|uniref:Protein-glutamate methylesterase/protein-glutamine glutaminase n=1 Tax=Benzoatithermus flavus TaxID=3108223 RepID=A0ABU8XXB5_9PROT